MKRCRGLPPEYRFCPVAPKAVTGWDAAVA